VAPVLPHTADEVWESAGFDPESVHLTDFPEIGAEWLNFPEREAMDRLLEVREVVARHLEELRRDKTIGLGLDAAVTLKVESDSLYALLDENRDTLAELFIVSQCKIEKVDQLPEASASDAARDLKLSVEVKKAEGNKCNRCWMITPTAGKSPEYSDVCPRCEGVLRRHW
jgi:isoleucyl-tRNA synthetase